MKVRILGLGNPILTDDGVGIAVARSLKKNDPPAGVEILEVEAGGMDLLGSLEGCDGAVIVDAIITGARSPGEVFELSLDDLPRSRRLRGAHDADLGSLVEIGKNMGMRTPKKVRVVAVEVEDNVTFGERLTPRVNLAVEAAALFARKAAMEMALVYADEE